MASTKPFLVTINFRISGVSYAALSSGVTDPLIAGLACQCTGQLKILKYNLQNLDERGERIYEKIRKCVDHHTAIIKYQHSISVTVT